MASYKFSQGAKYRFDNPLKSLLSLIDEHTMDPTARDQLKAGWKAMDETLSIRKIIGYREISAHRTGGS